MINRMKEFIDKLALAEAMPNVYNQYGYGSIENQIRRKNLFIYLNKMYQLRPRIILIGEAPGYRGSRLTGVPFTSEHLIINNMEGLNLFGRNAGYILPLEKDKLLKEATATMVWQTLVKYHILALGWNAFPFHPHKKGNPQSNRTPLKSELIVGEKFLLEILEIFNIEKIVAMGAKSAESLNKLNISCCKVRHPAQGGKNEFVEGMKAVKMDLLK